ncbi:NAC domain-containing protein 60-like [Rhodamnia argentea]|uniref:NAC domain-containing protein 60-like n=1 Tax=Rhodamnia argentea TaxID=178133 RepID=A0A8B8NFN6_9MYRT|nr:NAC domain-containing protein 60-like [Rhodamnia argentea]
MEGVCSNGAEGRIISMAEAASKYPGFKFSPSDAELISYYLMKKLEGLDKSVEQLIPEVDISAHEPWDLPAKSIIPSESEWFFFSVRGRKYPKGSQSKRATEHGYWKATGKERNVKSSSVVIGTKRTLVFHLGRAPKGKRMEWIMHEYSTNAKSQDSLVICRLRRSNKFHMNSASDLGSADLVQTSDVNRTDVFEGDKLAEGYARKCSGSHISHSVKEIDSGSNSSHQKNSHGNEDFYADILKDDIVKLDESSVSATCNILPTVPINLEPVPMCQDSEKLVQDLMYPIPPLQGTANRRIRLRREKLESSSTKVLEMKASDYSAEKAEPQAGSSEPSERRTSVIMGRWLVYGVLIGLSLLFGFVYLLGGFRRVRMIVHSS